jgi:sulfur carrier protein
MGGAIGPPPGDADVIVLSINGKQRELNGPQPLLDYLRSLGVNLRHIAVAYNGTVLPRSELAAVTLSAGDEVEIVRVVGGGC